MTEKNFYLTSQQMTVIPANLEINNVPTYSLKRVSRPELGRGKLGQAKDFKSYQTSSLTMMELNLKATTERSPKTSLNSSKVNNLF